MNDKDTTSAADERIPWEELGLSPKDLMDDTSLSKPESNNNTLKPVLAFGIGAAVVINVGFLSSLPPVLRGKGAPYLPTFERNMNAMFAQLRNEPQFSSQVITKTKTLNTQKFVDLGSGDGRVVFRAAREYNMFATSVGYEINPFLHAWASCQRIWSGPEIWSKTVFHCADLWHVNLRDANVVAVYGLGPIMKNLGVKLRDELKPGSYVLSNVFAIPGWKPVPRRADDADSNTRTYLYRTPECWEALDNKTPTE